MVRSERCNLNPTHIDQNRNLNPEMSEEDQEVYRAHLKKKGEDPFDPGGYFIINGKAWGSMPYHIHAKIKNCSKFIKIKYIRGS